MNLKPTPKYQPNKRITFEKRKKYALQKKTNTQRLNKEPEEENTVYLYNYNTCCQNENDKIEVNNLMISSGSVDSKIKKIQEKMDEDKLSKIKSSFEGNDNLDIDEGKEKPENNNNSNNDIQMECENELNEQKPEEIKVEIIKEKKIKNRERKINKEDEVNENTNDNNEKINNNKIEELSTNINTMNLDNIHEEQENIISQHINIIKNEAQLLSEEGNLLSKIKGINDENYTMEEYVPKIEEIINSKLSYFKELKQKIKEYKSFINSA